MKPFYFTMAFLLAGTAMLSAQEYPAPEGGPDTPQEPGRGIARISVINGDVSVRRGAGDVSAAVLNAPLMSGDTVLTSSAARAELQFDSANLARIAANSEVRMGDLQYHRNQIQVALGLVTFTVLRNSEAESEIDTPNVAIHPKGEGAYRIVVRDDGTTEITVRAGEADASTAQGSQVLRAGQTMMVRGTQDEAEFQIVAAGQQDDWDRWNAERDQQLLQATSTRYVNPDIYGTEDLDRNGRWVNDNSYGMVWTPNVGPDWAPYRDGRWVWADGYGWTWVGYEPWGWAPYHYGRWYHAGFGWAWWPGPYRGPCYWSPALVGFFGFGGGGGFGFGFGHVGWVPLAPYERFHPWWGRGGYRNAVIVNNFNVYNGYRNARVNGGITAVASNNFGRGGGRFMAMNGAQVRNAGLVRGNVPVTPERSSMRFSDRSVNMSNFRQSRNTQFFTRGGVQSTQQRGFAGSQPGSFRGSRYSSPVPNNGGASHGWSRFGEPIHSGSGNVTQPSRVPNGSANPQNGWSRFNGASNTPRQGYNSPMPTPNAGRSYNAPYNGGNNNAVRISPPIVRERANSGYSGGNGGGYNAPRPSYNPPAYSAPRNEQRYNAPAYSAPRNEQRYSAPAYNAPPSRSYSAPRNEQRYSAPAYNAPRYSAPTYSAPPSRSYSAPPSRSYSAPPSRSYSAPSGGGYRGGGGGGGGNHGGGGGQSSRGGGGHRR